MHHIPWEPSFKTGSPRLTPAGFLYLRILVHLVIYDSGQVFLEHLLLSVDRLGTSLERVPR